MNNITSLDQCQSREQVVSYISEHEYPEHVAARYALECSKDNDCLTKEEVEAHLDFLQEDGAIFDFESAFNIARDYLQGE